MAINPLEDNGNGTVRYDNRHSTRAAGEVA